MSTQQVGKLLYGLTLILTNYLLFCFSSFMGTFIFNMFNSLLFPFLPLLQPPPLIMFQHILPFLFPGAQFSFISQTGSTLYSGGVVMPITKAAASAATMMQTFTISQPLTGTVTSTVANSAAFQTAYAAALATSVGLPAASQISNVAVVARYVLDLAHSLINTFTYYR